MKYRTVCNWTRVRALQQIARLMAVAMVLLLGNLCPAQSSIADIAGTVNDAARAAIADCHIDLTDLATRAVRSTASNKDGAFSFASIPAGRYSLQIVAKGFKTYSVPSFTLDAGERATVSAVMPLGKTSEIVAGVATIASGVRAGLAGKAIQDVPENQRNYVNLANIQVGANEGSNAGAANGDTNRPGAQRMNSAISVNGQPDNLNQHMLDGTDNNERLQGASSIHPSVEGITSVQVKTSELGADIGRTSGGALLVTSKSGSSSFHGSLFEYLRNDVFDATAYQFGAHNNKPELRQNQFGGAIGGPIIKNKTFFFADYEGFRLIQGAMPAKATVPTLYEHENIGDFTDIGGAKLTTAQIDPVGLKYFELYPLPNSGTNTYAGAGVGTNFSHNVDARVDHKIRPNQAAFLRFSYNKIAALSPGLMPDVSIDGMTISPGGNIASFPGGLYVGAYNAQLNYTYSFSHNLFATLTTAFTSYDNLRTPLSYGQTPNATWGQSGVNIDQYTSGLAPITVTSGVGIGNGGKSFPNYEHNNNFEYKGVVTWTHGVHNIHIGGDLIRRQLRDYQNASGSGNWTFTSYQTLLTGVYTAATRSYSLVDQHFQMWEPSAFITDSSRLSKNLNVDLGVRYEIFTPFTEEKNYLSTFDPRTGTILLAGINGVSDTANIKTKFANISPRVGFAWQTLFSTTVTGSFGIGFYPSNSKSNAMMDNLPYAYGYGPCTSTTCPTAYQKFSGGLPMPSAPSMSNPTGTMGSAVDPKWTTSYSYFMNLAIRHSFKGSMVTLGYTGLLGRHMGQILPDINTPAPNTATAATVNTLRPYYAELPNVRTITFYQTEGISSYHSLRVIASRRMSNNFSYSFNYTLAHGLDDGTGPTNPSVGYSGFGVVPSLVGKAVDGHRFDYSNSNMDVRQRISVTATYNLPLGEETAGLRAVFLKDWQVNAVEAWSTGMPFSIANATMISGALPGSTNAERANIIGNPKVAHPNVGAFFNVNAFQAQQAGTIGQLLGSSSAVGSIGPYQSSRNCLEGPHNRKLDASLTKVIPLPSPAFKLVFRTEVFNLLNMANFAPPGNSLVTNSDGSASTTNGFGELRASSANYTPREIQFVLKMTF